MRLPPSAAVRYKRRAKRAGGHHGIHHVTCDLGRTGAQSRFLHPRARAASGQEDREFRRSGTYHLYYGDEQGAPGTILTFFPGRTRRLDGLAPGETQETAFRVPAASLGSGAIGSSKKGVTHGALEKRFGETVLTFSDGDGMHLALVGCCGCRE
jgi:glyoxalase family protein